MYNQITISTPTQLLAADVAVLLLRLNDEPIMVRRRALQEIQRAVLDIVLQVALDRAA